MSETGFLAKTLQKNQDFWSETRFLAQLLKMVQDLSQTNFQAIESIGLSANPPGI
jgi:hypothetical protein